jgi:uncharacterized membrane protein YgdD (TMEM256/DUF423 family)
MLAAISVALGAFGAHALKELLPPASLNTFETAVRYQFYHVFALAITGILYKYCPRKIIKNAGWFFLTGILLFSGSLYLITFFTLTGNNQFHWVGAITPLGGISFIAGWLLLAISVGKS